MALEPGAELAEGGELFHREITAAGEERIIDRRDMAGGKDEHVLSLPVAFPAGRIVFHFIAIQRGQEVGARHRAARVAAAGQGDHPDDVPAHLRRELSEFFYVFCHFE